MSQSHYKLPLSKYPAVYGVSYRTILRWAEKGYPLDDESATRALVGCQKNSGANSAPQLSGNGTRTHPTAETGRHGLSAALARLEAEEAESHASYREALENGQQEVASFRQQQWVKINEALRKAAKDAPEVAEANKKAVRLEELQAELGGLFVRLRQDVESLPQRISLELVGKDEIGIREILKREVEEIIQSLYACKYLGGGEDE